MTRRWLPILVIAQLMLSAFVPAGAPALPAVAAPPRQGSTTPTHVHLPAAATTDRGSDYLLTLRGVGPLPTARAAPLAPARVATLDFASAAGVVVARRLQQLQAAGSLGSFEPGAVLGTLRLHGLTSAGAAQLRRLHSSIASLHASDPAPGARPSLLSLRQASISRVGARSAASAPTNGLWFFVQQNLSAYGCYQIGSYYQLIAGVAPAGSIVTATAQLPDGSTATGYATRADYLTGAFAISSLYRTSPSYSYYSALPPGTVLTVQAAGITRQVTLNVSVAASSNGTVNGGGAAAGQPVAVVPGSYSGYTGPNRQTVTAGSSGTYSVNLGSNVGTYGFVYATIDAAGDIVATPYSVPGPLSLTLPGTIQGIAAPGSVVTVTESSAASAPVQSASSTAGGCDGSFYLTLPNPVTPGSTLTVSDSAGTPPRSMHIAALNVVPNPGTGQVVVTTDPNDSVVLYGPGGSTSGLTSTVQMFYPPYYGYLRQSGTADSTGAYTATFPAGEFAPSFTGQVQAQDAAGNSESRTYAVPSLQVLEGAGRLQAALPFSGPYTVTLAAPSGAVQATTVISLGPWTQYFAYDFEAPNSSTPLAIMAGSTITVTNGSQVASLTAGTLTVAPNVPAQTVTGSGPGSGQANQVTIRVHSGTQAMASNDYYPSQVTATPLISGSSYSANLTLGRPNRVEVNYDTSDTSLSNQDDQVYAIADLPSLVANLTSQTVQGIDTPSTFIVDGGAVNNSPPPGQQVTVTSSAVVTPATTATCSVYCSSPGSYGPVSLAFAPGDALTLTDQVGNVVPFSVVPLSITNAGSTISGNGPPNTPLTVTVTPPYYISGCANTSTVVTTDPTGAYSTTVSNICSGETLLVTYQDAQQVQETASALSNGPPPPSTPFSGSGQFGILIGSTQVQGVWYTANTTVTATLAHSTGAQFTTEGTSGPSGQLTLVFTTTTIASGDTITLTDGTQSESIDVNLAVAVGGSGTSLAITAPPNTVVSANIVRPPNSYNYFCGDATPQAKKHVSAVKDATVSAGAVMLSGTTDGSGQASLDVTHTSIGHLAGGDYALYRSCYSSFNPYYDQLPVYYTDAHGNTIMSNFVVPGLGVEVGTDLVAGRVTSGAQVTVTLLDHQNNVLATSTTRGTAPGYFDVCFNQGGQCNTYNTTDGPINVASGDTIQVADGTAGTTVSVAVPLLTAAANAAGSFVGGSTDTAGPVYVIAHTQVLSPTTCAPYDLICRANNVTPQTVPVSAGSYTASFTTTIFSPGDFGDSYALDALGNTFYAFWDVDPTAQQAVAAAPTATATTASTTTATAPAVATATSTATAPAAPTSPPFTNVPTPTPAPPATATPIAPPATATATPLNATATSAAPTATATLQPTNTPISAPPSSATASATATASITPTVELVKIEDESISPARAAILQALLTEPGLGSAPQVFRLLVPAGAVTQSVTIRVSAATLDTLPAGSNSLGSGANVQVGAAVDLTAINNGTGQEVHQFARPLTLQLSYDPQELAGLGINPATLHLAFFEPSPGSGPGVLADTTSLAGTWISVDTTVDTTHHLLTARIPHFTLFAVRATARTQAQVQQAQGRLATLAAGGPPRGSILPTTNNAPLVDGIPLVVTLPQGQQHAPIDVVITGKPGATVATSFVVGGATVARRTTLDVHGYATVRFTPAHAPSSPRAVKVGVIVRGTQDTQTLSGAFTLLPGPAPKGASSVNLTAAPSLGLVLKVGVSPSPVHHNQSVTVNVTTAPKAAVHVQVYRGSREVAAQSGPATIHGTQSFVFAAAVLVPAGDKQTLSVLVTAQSGAHGTTQHATLVVVP